MSGLARLAMAWVTFKHLEAINRRTSRPTPATGLPPNGGVNGRSNHSTGPLPSPLHHVEVNTYPHDDALPQETAILPYSRPGAS